VRLKPLGDRILVKRVKPQEKTIGGIVLPETARDKLNEGIVVAVGPGSRGRDGQLLKPSVEVGDHVLLSEFGGTEVKLDGEEYHLFREDDILGVLKQ
jgi:chaperonin GroES